MYSSREPRTSARIRTRRRKAGEARPWKRNVWAWREPIPLPVAASIRIRLRCLPLRLCTSPREDWWREDGGRCEAMAPAAMRGRLMAGRHTRAPRPPACVRKSYRSRTERTVGQSSTVVPRLHSGGCRATSIRRGGSRMEVVFGQVAMVRRSTAGRGEGGRRRDVAKVLRLVFDAATVRAAVAPRRSGAR